MKLEAKQKLSLLAMTMFVILVLGTISYAFFTVIMKNTNPMEAVINTANVTVTFKDRNLGFNKQLAFGKSATKQFTIENTGDTDTTVKMFFDEMINTYKKGSLTYTLSYSETEEGPYTEIVSKSIIPKSLESSRKKLANRLFIPKGQTYYYNLEFTLNILDNVNQTEDLNATFGSKFDVEDAHYTSNTIMTTADYINESMWKHRESIKSVIFEGNLVPKEDAAFIYDISTNQDRSVMSYLVSDPSDKAKYIAYIQGKDKVIANTDSSELFSSFISLQNIENLALLDTSKAINMSEMFSNLRLTTLDVSNFDTSNVTDMAGMFYDCFLLTTLDVSNFDTSKVTDMSWMFYYCTRLTTLNVSNFDTGNVTDMSGLFDSCYSLATLDVSNFDTSKVTDMSNMFTFCEALTFLNVSNFVTNYVTDMSNMFCGCSSLTVLDVSTFDTSNVTDMYSMFGGCSSLTTLDVSNFVTTNVIYMDRMFAACQGLTTLDLSNFVTSNVTSMWMMFNGSSNLTTLDLSNFVTTNVTNMSTMFYLCSNLTTLDLSNFDTSNVADMSSMFGGCSSLTTLNLSNFDTSSVTNMSYMFNNCKNLTTLDLSNFDTSNVADMSSMFEGCSSLTTLNLSNFDTSSVTNMSYMFNNCKNLTTLNLNNWNMPNVKAYLDVKSSIKITVSSEAIKQWVIECNSSKLGDSNFIVV